MRWGSRRGGTGKGVRGWRGGGGEDGEKESKINKGRKINTQLDML